MTQIRNIYVVSNRNNGRDYNYTLKSEALKFAKAQRKLGYKVWLAKVTLSTGKTEMLKF